MNPRQSLTTHTEQLGDEASVYDWARAQVHALNPTAAWVWRLCDGATSRDAIAAALRVEMGIPEADAVVDLTLKQLARVHLLELPVELRGDRSAPTRRWLLGRGVAAAMLPAIYSIVAPSSVDAQSLPAAAPTLTSLSPNQGLLGTTVAVTLTGTNFVIGATTVTVNSGGVTAANVIVSSATSLTANIVIEAAATPGAHTVTVTTAGGTSAAQTFTVNAAASPTAPTLTSVTPNSGLQGATVAVTLTGTNFVVAGTTVNGGAGVTVNTIVVGSATSLTANFVIDPAAAAGARTVTVTTAVGTSGTQIFTVDAAAPPPVPTLTSVSPNQGTKGTTATTVAVTLTGTNFVAPATVAVSGMDVAVNTIVVVNSTTLTASFVLEPAAATGARTVTVTTSGGTSGGQIFTINPASAMFTFTGGVQPFTVPLGVTALMATARGAQGGMGASPGGLGGSVAATLAVVPGEILNVFVGGQGGDDSTGVGGFNGGGAGGVGFFRGGGGGASDIRRGGVRVVVAGGGGGGAFGAGGGGAGGGTTGGTGTAAPTLPSVTVTGGAGGTQLAGGLGGTNSVSAANNGQPGASGIGGAGGLASGAGASGGGGGGGYFGGGGGAGANFLGSGAGGGGSSLDAPGFVHTQGNRAGNGEVVITW